MTTLFTAAMVQVGSGAHAEPGLIDFFLRSGPMAKLVLGVLVLFSLGSWGIMLWKWLQLKRADRQSERFLEIFHRSRRFSEVTSQAEEVRASPLLGVFQAGYAEIDAQIKAGGQGEGRSTQIRSLDGVHRSLKRALAAELRELARHTGFLATTAAATPFIGLFGTVWGIMVAFQQIGMSGSTSIDTIAPGIAEALINTAAGLGAAIPALIGYNYFASRLRQVKAKTDDFVYVFLNLTERYFT